MASIEIKIPDGDIARVYEAFGKTYGYQAILEDGQSNPEKLEEFAKGKIAGYVSDIAQGFEVNEAVDAARLEALKKKVIVTVEAAKAEAAVTGKP